LIIHILFVFVVDSFLFAVLCLLSQKEKRFAALTTSLSSIMTDAYGYVPRDYFNLELRHHHAFTVIFMLFRLV